MQPFRKAPSNTNSIIMTWLICLTPTLSFGVSQDNLYSPSSGLCLLSYQTPKGKLQSHSGFLVIRKHQVIDSDLGAIQWSSVDEIELSISKASLLSWKRRPSDSHNAQSERMTTARLNPISSSVNFHLPNQAQGRLKIEAIKKNRSRRRLKGYSAKAELCKVEEINGQFVETSLFQNLNVEFSASCF